MRHNSRVAENNLVFFRRCYVVESASSCWCGCGSEMDRFRNTDSWHLAGICDGVRRSDGQEQKAEEIEQ